VEDLGFFPAGPVGGVLATSPISVQIIATCIIIRRILLELVTCFAFRRVVVFVVDDVIVGVGSKGPVLLWEFL
jgi:hypothetical protein